MFIYNITTQVDALITADWIRWQKEIHIPELMATGAFFDHRFYQLAEEDTHDTITYVIQLYCHSRTDYEDYVRLQAARLREKAFTQWGHRFISFRTLLMPV